MECIFCKIIKKEQAADIVYEDEKFVAFKDIKPLGPIHLLLVSKVHIESVNDLRVEDREFIGNLLLLAKRLANEQGIRDSYKLVFNVGRKGGQLIDHLHLHLVGGWKKGVETVFL